MSFDLSSLTSVLGGGGGGGKNQFADGLGRSGSTQGGDVINLGGGSNDTLILIVALGILGLIVWAAMGGKR